MIKFSPEYKGDDYKFILDHIEAGILEIDNDGKIWRLAHKNKNKEWIKKEEKTRAENIGGKGYLRISVGFEGKTITVMAHKVVYIYFKKVDINDNMQINHKDLDKQNNKIDNLELVTGKENINHSYQNGRIKPWSRVREGFVPAKRNQSEQQKNKIEGNPQYRGKDLISDDIKRDIVKMRKDGFIFRDISDKFKISMTHIQRICKEFKDA